MKVKNIRVKEDVWWELNKIKVNKKLSSISKVVELLIEKEKSQS